MTVGSSTDSCAEAAAERPSMNTVASGVRVTDACVAAIRLITQAGISAAGTTPAKPCATAAAAKNRGKMTLTLGRSRAISGDLRQSRVISRGEA